MVVRLNNSTGQPALKLENKKGVYTDTLVTSDVTDVKILVG
jgi:hypothetical protein